MKHFLNHFFLPRESNNHRAKLLQHDSLLFVIIFLVICSFLIPSLHQNFPQVLGISSTITPEQLLVLTNQQRQQHGFSTLHLDSELAQAATQKAADMFTKNYWAHIAPDGVTPWVFIKSSGYDYLYAGENLARGFTTANDVVNAWMASPSHRENLLSANYNDVGFAVATGSLTGSDTILVVQEFGSRYIANSSDQRTAENSVVSYPSPSPISKPLIAGKLTPPPSLVPSPVEITQNLPVIQPQNSLQAVAALQNPPLVDSKKLTQHIAIGILLLFIIILAIDAIIIERKKIARVVAHNLDHIIYLAIILLLVIILGRGLIL